MFLSERGGRDIVAEDFDKNNAPEMKFLCNPLFEMVQSLYVLNDPNCHEDYRQWVIRTRKSLSPRLRREMPHIFRGSKGMRIITDFWTIKPGLAANDESDREIFNSIKAVRNLQEPLFSFFFLGLSTEKIKPARVMEWLENPDSIDDDEWIILNKIYYKPYIENYFKNREALKDNLSWVLWNYWEEYFKGVWPAIKQHLGEAGKDVNELYERKGFVKYMCEMHKDIIFDGKYLLFLKNPDYGILIDDISEVRMMLSMFSWPRLMANTIGKLVTGTYNVPFKQSILIKEITPEVKACLNALNDNTRLKIMKLIWNDFHTTKEIAKDVGISEGGVSLHLKLFKSARIVETRRIKKYVYYRMKKAPFQNAWKEIERYLEDK